MRKAALLGATLSRALAIAAAVLVFGILMAKGAAGQVCLGNPAAGRQFTLGGGVSFSDGATGYNVGARANLEGPVSIGGRIGIVDVDNLRSNVTTLGASLAWELPVEGFGACPVAGIGYATWSDRILGVDVDLSQLSFPLGLAVGVRLDGDGPAALFPSAEAGLFHRRMRGSVARSGERYTETDSETEFYVGAGATLVFGRFFVGASVEKTTIEGSDAVVSLGSGSGSEPRRGARMGGRAGGREGRR